MKDLLLRLNVSLSIEGLIFIVVIKKNKSNAYS
jgi:hypothetical protein